MAQQVATAEQVATIKALAAEREWLGEDEEDGTNTVRDAVWDCVSGDRDLYAQEAQDAIAFLEAQPKK